MCVMQRSRVSYTVTAEMVNPVALCGGEEGVPRNRLGVAWKRAMLGDPSPSDSV